MATAPSVPPSLPEDLAPAVEGVRLEWVRGEWRERLSMGLEAAWISTRLMTFLNVHVMATRAGWCMSHECGYKIFADEPNRARFPDGSFIGADKLVPGQIPRGYTHVVPDLIFEVVSPNDKAEDVEERLTDFLRAGVGLAWVIYPGTRQIYVYHQGPESLRLGLGDTLDGEGVLPGFACPLADLFASL